jgi:hypothetical protein
MRRILFTLMLLTCPVALATTVYKWVDENGVLHYSDQPHPNAEKLQLQGVQTYSASAATVRGPPEPAARSAPSANTYKGCIIAQPVDQQNLPNADSVFVRVASDPMPRAEDRVFITVDGQGVNGGQPTGLSFSVTPIDRGEHTVSAQIRGPGDEVLCRTQSVTFFVQQRNLFSPPPAGPTAVSPRPH